MSEAVCNDWFTLPLGQLAELRRGITYSSSMLESEEDGLPYVNMKSFLKGGGFNPDGTKSYVGAYAQNDLVGDRDLLIANTDVTAGDIVGVPALLPDHLAVGKVLYSHHVTRLRINGDISVPFLYYLFCLPEYRSHMLRISRGTTVLMLDMHAIKRIPVRAPKVEADQNRIVEILTTLDEAIQQTETLIAKMQQVKAGLMHDLFTRGVTPDGHLRPTREQAPALYKESPLGWIPQEWEVLIVDELLAKTACPMRSGPFGSALLKDELVEEGIPFLGIDNIFIERFYPRFNRYVSMGKYQELIRYSVFPRDVIITIMGTVGRCCVVPEHASPMLSSKHLWTMTFDAGRVLPELVCWQLNHASWVKNWFACHSQGAVMEAIQSSTLRNLKLPVPSIEEQKQIYDCYVGCSQGIEAEEECLAKVRHQKHGLMQDLLAGESPVARDRK